jgi:hypothetical protein
VQEVCRLYWDWEVEVSELGTSLFLIPAEISRTRKIILVVLDDMANSLIGSQWGEHPSRVFTYRGHSLDGIYNSAWKNARVKTVDRYAKEKGEPVSWEFTNVQVHSLKLSFGRRLRAAGVPFETRKDLLGYRNGGITSHYSAPEILELLMVANRVCEANFPQKPRIDNNTAAVPCCLRPWRVSSSYQSAPEHVARVTLAAHYACL